MQKTGIEWADYSWNPVSGCLHKCEYGPNGCYAATMANRYNRSFEPAFHEEKLKEIIPVAGRGGVVFCGSNCDLWGSWVDGHWIYRVLHHVAGSRSSVMMLTKNPARYKEFVNMPALNIGSMTFEKTFPNLWLGTTLDAGYKSAAPPVEDRIAAIHGLQYPRKWVSIEPFDPKFSHYYYDHVMDGLNVQWVVVGTKTPGKVHGSENVDEIVNACQILGIPCFVKNSIYEQWPDEQWPREFPAGVRLATKSPEWKVKVKTL